MTISLEEIWKNYNMDELQEGVDRLFPQFSFSLTKLMEMLLQGDIGGAVQYLMEGTIGMLKDEIGSLKDILLLLILLGIASSILTHFVEIFDKHQIADLGYYFMYLLFMMILFRCFERTMEIAGNTLESIVVFIQLVIPTYLLSVGVAGGLATAGAYSQLFVAAVYGVESLLRGWVLDMISIYIMFSMMNGIWVEEKLKQLVDLLHKVIGFILKGALGVVTGFSFFQSLISPLVDTAKNTAIHKVVSSVPGIGDMTEGVLQLVLGSAVIIKNSIGVMLLLLLVVICAAPILQIWAIAWILQIAAALLGLISDKRLVNCTNYMGEGCMLVFRTVGTAMLLFVILISLIAVSTNTIM